MHSYVSDYQSILKVHANPQKAGKMKKYMLNQFAYYGIQAPDLRALQRQYLRKTGFPPKNELFTVVKDCWSAPQRELQYFGQELMEYFSKKGDWLGTAGVR